MKKKDFDIVIVGAGPSGIFCAIFASERGLRVALIDRNSKIGGKIPITGNCRCNLTNQFISSENYTGENPMFVKNVLARYSSEDLIDFFRNLNMAIVSEGDRFYPMTKKSETVVEVLDRRVRTKNITILTDTNVMKCEKILNEFHIHSTTGDISSNSIAICSGGKSYSKLFKSGGGYSIAKSFSHTVTKLYPGLTSLDTDSEDMIKLSGVSLEAEVSLFCGEEKVFQRKGSLLFTHRGFSGPVAMDASNRISKCNGLPVNLSICFLSGKLKNFESFMNHINGYRTKLLKNSISGILPASLTEAAMQNIRVRDDIKVNEARRDTLMKLHKVLTNFNIRVKKNGDFDEAQVTVGGVRTSEIDPKRMESKLVKNLFFAGEILDIAGDCGGYNLQFAFSTGKIAGMNA